MYRGTTPTFRFKLPIQADTITVASITFRQDGAVNIEKSLADCEASENILSVSLTEEETLSLRASSVLQIQLRVGVGDTRLASQIWTVSVERILKDGAL